MNILIGGLPDETNKSELRQMLEALGCPVVAIRLFESSYHNRGTAVVELNTNELGCNAMAKQINGHYWHVHKLRAERPLFGNK